MTVEESLVPVSVAQRLLARREGKPIARPTVLAMAGRGELTMHVVAGRFVITRDSINAHLERRGRDAAEGD